MKKITLFYFLFLIIITIVEFMPSIYSNSEVIETKIYFVDKQMMRLVPLDYYISSASKEKMAKAVLETIIIGKNDVDKINRLIPEDKKCMSVKLSKDSAIVNINSAYIPTFSQGRINEELIVFQLVNSLTSLEGITNVKFTIDNKPQKDFLGFLDMRETYIPDYCV